MNSSRLFLSILLAVVLTGCQGQPSPAPTTPSTNAEHVHGHHHVAPHNGALIALGEETAHLELVLEPTSGTLTVYLLDGNAETAVRLPGQPIKIQLDSGTSVELLPQADELTGETKDDTSTFQAKVQELEGVEAFSGTLPRLELKGRTFENVKLQYPQGNESAPTDEDHNHDDHNH